MPDEANELQSAHAFLFIIFGSLFLLLLFFFLEYIEKVLTVMIAIGSTAAITFAMDFAFENVSCESTISLPYIGIIKQKLLLIFTISASLVATYVITRNWILNNIIGICYTFMVIKSVKITSFKVGALLLGLAFFYDIFWVFMSASIFGGNVMVTVATGLDLPLKIQCPHMQEMPRANTCGMIGLGDLALPGLLLAYASRLDNIQNSQYLKTLMICYAIALTMCVLVLAFFQSAQPALLYISPMLILGMLFHAMSRHELKKIWEGRRPLNLLPQEISLQEYKP